jgi:hypothetical protein
VLEFRIPDEPVVYDCGNTSMRLYARLNQHRRYRKSVRLCLPDKVPFPVDLQRYLGGILRAPHGSRQQGAHRAPVRGRTGVRRVPGFPRPRAEKGE